MLEEWEKQAIIGFHLKNPLEGYRRLTLPGDVGDGVRALTQNRLRRGVFRDVEELITAIGDYIDRHNHNPKPFV